MSRSRAGPAPPGVDRARRLGQPGRRFGIGAASENDDAAGKRAVFGVRTYVLAGDPVVTQADVEKTSVKTDEGSYDVEPPSVNVVFTKPAGERFHALTKENLERRIAIVIDGMVDSAPVVQTEIPGGTVTISMREGDRDVALAEAKRLAAGLRGRATP